MYDLYFECKHGNADDCIVYILCFSGIVTRRPLVLQLNQIEKGQQDYAQFLHTGNKRITDFCMSFTASSKDILGLIHLDIYFSSNANQIYTLLIL